MKTKIDIVSGFIGSGKTTLINSILKEHLSSENKIVVIQCEFGEEEIIKEALESENIVVEKLNDKDISFSEIIQDIINNYHPGRIIIEYNGMSKLSDLLESLKSPHLRKISKTDNIICTVDAKTYGIFSSNLGASFFEKITGSGVILLNNTEGIPKSELESIKGSIKALNKQADIAFEFKPDTRKYDFLSSVLLSVLAASAIFFVISLLRYFNVRLPDIDTLYSYLQIFSTIFLSILIQAFPFILLGVFISSVIQVFVKTDTITKVFSKNKGLSYIMSILAGLFFPVCDCAIIPVSARLIKKGVPVPISLVFMLVAPIINPIVIASTLYAFPGQPQIALYRVLFGIIIALLVSIIFILSPPKNLFKKDVYSFVCKCGSCGEDTDNSGIFKKIDSIFRHACSEFFEVGKFLIAGSFFSSLVQVAVPPNVIASIGGGTVVSLLVMMAAAFILSVCSTSDAFIARSFSSYMPTGAIMGFMVLGPMIDLKNLLMLTGSFNKRFVIKLVGSIILVSFFSLYILNLFILR